MAKPCAFLYLIFTAKVPSRSFGFLTSTVAYGSSVSAQWVSTAVASFRGRVAVTEGDAVGVERSAGRERRVPLLSPVLGPESAPGVPTALPDLAVGAGRGADFALPGSVAPHPDKAMTAAVTTPAVMCTRLITSLFRRTEPQDRFRTAALVSACRGYQRAEIWNRPP